MTVTWTNGTRPGSSGRGRGAWAAGSEWKIKQIKQMLHPSSKVKQIKLYLYLFLSLSLYLSLNLYLFLGQQQLP